MAPVSRAALLLPATACLLFFGTTAHAAAVLGIGNRTIVEDTVLEADTIIFDADARLRVKNGAHVTIRARLLELRGTVFIDGVGAVGKLGGDGRTPRPWKSCETCTSTEAARCHERWKLAGNLSSDRGGNGSDGGAGGDGAIVEIEFESLRGAPNGVSDTLRYDVRGGAGGAGGAAGKGRELTCGCHPSEKKRAPDGAKGKPGKPGRAGSVSWRASPPSRPVLPLPRPLPKPSPKANGTSPAQAPFVARSFSIFLPSSVSSQTRPRRRSSER
ncbi:MAG: hypothetical protein HOV80_02190 [Polyangiaceae bacterium]|nr:hypothetical protein [Polyangiaceae bacterium]